MIILTLQRKTFGADYCAGYFLWDGSFFCNTLEDTDRQLHSFMKDQAISQVKVKAETAIPYGFYEVIIDHSAHFGKDMPHVLNVPGFEGIRLHGGSKVAHSEGCPLLGMKDADNTLKDGLKYSADFMAKLTEALSVHRVFLSVCR